MKKFQIIVERLSESLKKILHKRYMLKKNDPGAVSKSAAGTTLESRSTKKTA